MVDEPEEDDSKVNYLFPNREETGPLIFASKELGLADAIAQIAKRLETENEEDSSK